MLLLASSLFTMVSAPTDAQALSGSDFNAGNIISDAKFFDGNAMDAGGVQNFLNAQVPSCRAGYTCLKSYTENTWTRAADAMCGQYNGAGSESSAQIIAKVGQVCGISQKVLLVLLQKEQSLVTDTWPDAGQFRSATGFACPDTAPCDSQYYGFYNQVYKAAWQYKRYTNPPGTSAFFTWFPVGAVSNVRYHPNADCGSSPVLIQNQATAALYYYTPYQPNASALSNLYGGQNDGCSSYGNRNFWRLYWDWFGSPQGVDYSPIGSLDSVKAGFKTVTVAGWTFDPETSGSIQVHAYVGGPYGTGAWAGAFTANTDRPDIAARWPSYGSKHGFSFSIPTPSTPQNICVYAINLGQGTNTLLGCLPAQKPTGVPYGNVEKATLSGRTATIAGWAIDPDVATPIAVHAYVNGGWGGAFVADKIRNDVGAAYPGYGSAHGFEVQVPVPVGTNEVCIFGINDGLDGNPSLGCVTVSSATGPPVGSVDDVVVTGFQGVVRGWALDPDTAAPIDAHVYVNGAWAGAVHADGARADVGRAYPGYGDSHGYSLPVALKGGQNEVCVYGINVKGGNSNPSLGCRTVTLPTGRPIGNFESVVVSNGTATLNGWTLDPDSPATIPIHVYVDGGWAGAFTAGESRADVQRAYPAYGPLHGFSVTIPVKPGQKNVCVYGIDGLNEQIGCKSLQ
ncbi:hypothetical protein [Agreia pratensis]|uniref:hypothetical protein n=1 Tax=Agreia pratensis TaxID=150121 RepID=UPI00111C0C89|nr:hypothetical protein [Agreia pratensis]